MFVFQDTRVFLLFFSLCFLFSKKLPSIFLFSVYFMIFFYPTFSPLPHPSDFHLPATIFNPITESRSLFVPQHSNQCVYRMKNNRATKRMHAVHSCRPLISRVMREEARGHGRSRNCSGVKTDLRLQNGTFTFHTRHSNLSHNTNSSVDFPVGQEAGNGGFGDSKIYFHLLSFLNQLIWF